VRPYEVVFIVKPEIDEEGVNSIIERLVRIVGDSGGKIDNGEKWGRKRLAYEIEGCTEGSYVMMDFTVGTGVAREMERVLKLTDEVIRYLLIRRDED